MGLRDNRCEICGKFAPYDQPVCSYRCQIELYKKQEKKSWEEDPESSGDLMLDNVPVDVLVTAFIAEGLIL